MLSRLKKLWVRWEEKLTSHKASGHQDKTDAVSKARLRAEQVRANNRGRDGEPEDRLFMKFSGCCSKPRGLFGLQRMNSKSQRGRGEGEGEEAPDAASIPQ